MKIKSNTEDEARDILIRAGVQFFRNRAGFVPNRAHGDHWADAFRAEIVTHRAHRVFFDKPIYRLAALHYDEWARVHGVIIKLDLCWKCVGEFRKCLEHPTLVFTASAYIPCAICGKALKPDDIPF